MATSKYGISRFQSAIKVSQLPPQSQQNPTVNNNPNSSKDGTYPYNAPQQRSQEPIVTSSSGTQSSKPVQPQPDYESRVTRLQERLNIATKPQPVQAVDNLKIAKEQQHMQDVNYKEMIPYLEEWQNRSFNRDATYAGIKELGNALGGNVDYKQWWSGGLVK